MRDPCGLLPQGDNPRPQDPSTSRGKLADNGMTAETKEFYRKNNWDPWEEWTDQNIGIDGRSSVTSAKYALIVRREKEGDADEPKLSLHSITVQSPLIREILGPVFEGYSGINTNLNKLEFKAPFREFYYRWDEFNRADPTRNGSEDSEACSHFKLLASIVHAEIKPHIEQVSDLLRNGVISFDYVWALFDPDTEVFTKVEGHDRLFWLSSSSYGKVQDGGTAYILTARYIDTDGDSFGYRSTCLPIWSFENLKPISELEVIPSRLCRGIAGVKERLVHRGQVFESLKGINHRTYSGLYTIPCTRPGVSNKRHVIEERIIIDSKSYSLHTHSTDPLESLDKPKGSEVLGNEPQYEGLQNHHRAQQSQRYSTRSSSHGTRSMTMYLGFSQPPKEGTGNKKLTKSQYALCSHVVRGFCLKGKRWGTFDVDLIKGIEWNSTAFDQLVLPHDYKRIIHAFAGAQLSGLDNFDDVVKGKGRGMIMLLSGEPGTGKTLTAESVAEIMKKPLYSMSAAELGCTGQEVEEKLGRALELSNKWGAVLLLDECDVFLECRSPSDIKRNTLVAIFLRLLEYYQGIMFMTTNRVSTFDPAFESRIHLTIQYPNLDHKSRLHIWKTFVSIGTNDNGLSEAELDELAKIELNGRQIKNIVKTARLLATNEKTQLAMGHISTVLRIKKGFSGGL